MAQANLSDITWDRRNWAGSTAYAESKLYDVLLAFAISRRWPEAFSNALEPGWVATQMGVQVRRMISTKLTSLRHGWQSAMNRLRWWQPCRDVCIHGEYRGVSGLTVGRRLQQHRRCTA
jgi:NAD(P)-dependent dehydrogenase (short-subunit alcohol dehydrogenase family)